MRRGGVLHVLTMCVTKQCHIGVVYCPCVCRSDRQARDLAHCMTYLTISDKSVRRLLDNSPCYKDWLTDKIIYDSFTLLLTKAKKFMKTEVKGQIEELERMMYEAHTKGRGETSINITECKLAFVAHLV